MRVIVANPGYCIIIVKFGAFDWRSYHENISCSFDRIARGSGID